MAITLDPAEAAPALGKILDSTSQATVETARTVAGEHDARARRHAAIAQRLAGTLGEQDARVLALRRTSDQSRRLALDLTRGSALIASHRTPPPGSFVFTGRVTDATGAAVPGVRARLSDRTGKLRGGGAATTDDSGAFLLVVPPDTVRREPELFLVVEDTKGRVLHTSPGPVQIKQGVVQRIDLAIETSRPPETKPTPGPGSGRRTGRRAPRKPSK